MTDTLTRPPLIETTAPTDHWSRLRASVGHENATPATSPPPERVKSAWGRIEAATKPLTPGVS